MTLTTNSSTDVPAALRENVAQSRKLFVDAANELRPRLHRFCTRMCHSSLDGEDVVQEVLADAFYNLASLKESTRLEPWLFRIAYFKCIDFLRRERRRDGDILFDERHDVRADGELDTNAEPLVDDAVATIVGELPPKERAAVILKDVLDYPLAEIANIADTTLAGAKAALHRGRTKLRARSDAPSIGSFDAEQRRLFEAYAECFNRRDWDALRQLVRADARLEIVGEAEGRMSGLGKTYSGNYTGLPWEWKLSANIVDGAPALVHWKRDGTHWHPHAAIRLWSAAGEVVRIRDYIHVEYLLRFARIAPAS